MKKIMPAFLLLLIAWSCKKNEPIKTTPVIVKPTAFFRINNLVNSNEILEANIADFENTSLNADSYSWDFGNGVHSSQKIPQNISFTPCGGNYTISLVVKNKAGESKYEQNYTVLCRGKNAHTNGKISLSHYNSAQIAKLKLQKEHSTINY
jgi:PKD repeat protein